MAWNTPRPVSTISYTVSASSEQARRWETAVGVEGYGRVDSWIPLAVDRYLQHVARSGRLAPLPWFWDRFRVLVTDTSVRPAVTQEIEVRGEVCRYFGIYRGDLRGPGEPGCNRFTLVHLPTRYILDTLPLRKSAKALGAELAALRVNWQESDPEKVVEGAPDQEKARALLQLFEKLTHT